MKRLEEIENMSFEELERVADDATVQVPPRVAEAAKAGMMAAETARLGHRRTQPRRTALYLAAAAVACALVVVTVPTEPEDSFTDPELAYLQVERTMSLIAQKMDSGLTIAENAPDPIEKMNEIIDKINR